MNNDRPKLAVFFDAENVSLQHAPPILEKLSVDWEVHLRRAYGSNIILQQEILRELSIIPVEVVRNAHAKNAADLTLAVDAVEELCLGFSDGICIVSGDSDFTRLVQRIREKGKAAIVFGNANTPASLRNACTAFHLATASKQAQNTAMKTGQKPKASEKPVQNAGSKQKTKSTSNADKKAESPKAVARAASPKAAVALQSMDGVAAASLRQNLHRAFQEFRAISGDDPLAQFGHFIRESYPQLQQRMFGFASLRSFLNNVGGFHAEAVRDDRGVICNYRLSLAKDGVEKAAEHSRVSGNERAAHQVGSSLLSAAASSGSRSAQ